MTELFGNAESALTLQWFTILKQIHGVVNAKKDGLPQEIPVFWLNRNKNCKLTLKKLSRSDTMNLTLRFYSMVGLSTKMPSLNQIHSNSSLLRALCSANMIKILRAVRYLLTYAYFSSIVRILLHVTFLRASQKKEELMKFQRIIQILSGKQTCLGCITKKEH